MLIARIVLMVLMVVCFVLGSPLAAVQAQSLDEYGGYVDLPAPGGGTGFFRVAKAGERWVLVTPAGNQFWMRAVWTVNDALDGGQLYRDTITAKYGGIEGWRLNTVRRLKSWGFNALGQGARLQALPAGIYNPNPEKMPFIRMIRPNFNGTRTGVVKDIVLGTDPAIYTGWRGGRVADFFDPAFRPYVVQALTADMQEVSVNLAPAQNPWLIGYSLDDDVFGTGLEPGVDPGGAPHAHMGWMVAVTAPTQTQNAALGVTYADPTVYSKRALRDWLKTKYGTLAQLNAAWGAAYTGWDSDGGWPLGKGFLDESGRNLWIKSNGYDLTALKSEVRGDLDAFLGMFFEEYFRVSAEEIRTRLPNHLVIGPSAIHSGARPPVLRAAGRYLDVLQTSVRPDPNLVSQLATRAYDISGKPVFFWLTFTAQADSEPAGTPWSGGWDLPTQEERGQAYASFIAQILAARGTDGSFPAVGIDWWEYIDKWVGGEQHNFGLVSRRDNAYDGREAVTALGTDPWGYATGGEPANYGDLLTAVTAANGQFYREAGVEPPPPSSGDETPLSVSISSPTSGSVVNGTVVVSASGSQSAIRIDLFLNGALTGVFSGPSAKYPWNTAAASNGSHAWFARAYGATSNTSESAPVEVIVSNGDTTAPTVAIISPEDGTSVARRRPVTVTATATDNVGVARVEFLVNDTPTCSVTTEPYICVWQVSAANNKSYRVEAIAYDARGNVGRSNAVRVTAR